MINSPCKDCGDRVIGCHSTCESYLQYCCQKDKLNNDIKRKKEAESYYNSGKCYFHRAKLGRKD